MAAHRPGPTLPFLQEEEEASQGLRQVAGWGRRRLCPFPLVPRHPWRSNLLAFIPNGATESHLVWFQTQLREHAGAEGLSSIC